jgi:hypothetical protein
VTEAVPAPSPGAAICRWIARGLGAIARAHLDGSAKSARARSPASPSAGACRPRRGWHGTVEETVVVDGARLTAAGLVEERPVAAGYREAARARVLHGTPGAPVVLTLELSSPTR